MEDFSKKTTAELHSTLVTKRDELRKFRFEMTGSKIKNVKHGMALRKDIARILTVLNNQNDK
ncbi:MAG TPA: 50S ribosomal protein L29 [Candidatus Paceibacterota bacterium]